MAAQTDSKVLGFTVAALSIALGETPKVRADGGSRQREPLDEAQDLALQRARRHLRSPSTSSRRRRARSTWWIAPRLCPDRRAHLSERAGPDDADSTTRQNWRASMIAMIAQLPALCRPKESPRCVARGAHADARDVVRRKDEHQARSSGRAISASASRSRAHPHSAISRRRL